MKSRHHLSIVLVLALVLIGCAKPDGGGNQEASGGKAKGPSTMFKPGGFARLVNASDEPLDAFAGHIQFAGRLRPGAASSYALVGRGKREFRIQSRAGEEFKVEHDIESGAGITIYAYLDGGKRRFLLEQGDPRFAEGTDPVVRVANFSGSAISASGPGNTKVANGLRNGALGDVTKVRVGSASFTVVQGGIDVAKTTGSLESGQAYTLLVLPDSRPGSVRVSLFQNTIKMEAVAEGSAPM